MSERYTRVFSLTENLYAEGAPVIIRAGALLKDNLTGNILAQLKFENIDPRPIKALTVSVQPIDVKGNLLGDSVSHQYLDLNQERDSQFGQKKAIHLPDARTRSFTAVVTEAVFSDGSIWNAADLFWEVLNAPTHLNMVWRHELIEQYRLECGNTANFQFQHIKDLWYCSCGSLNRNSETECHKCGQDLSFQEQIDPVELQERADARLQKQKQEQEELRLAEEARKASARKKAKKFSAIAAATIVIAILLDIIISNVCGYHYAKVGDYEKVAKIVYAPEITRIFNHDFSHFVDGCKLLVSKDYVNAQITFDMIPGYLSSDEMVIETGCQGIEAFLAQDNYDKANEILNDLKGRKYTDPSRVNECEYLIGKYAFDVMNDPSQAQKVFESLANTGYKDSQKLYEESMLQWATDLIDSESYESAASVLKKIENTADAKPIIASLEKAMYEKGVECYHQKNYNVALQNFRSLDDTYKDTHKYEILLDCRLYHSSLQEKLDQLLPILSFEDADIVLLNGQSSQDFLTGKWREKSGYHYFTMDDNGGITSNLPWIDYGDYYRIEDGVFLLYYDQSYNTTRNLFSFSVKSKDCVDVYCHKDGRTYTLYRQ